MATKIGSLLIDLNANVAQLQKDFAKAQATMDGALGKMGAALKSFAGLAGAYLGGQAILNFVDNAIDGAAQIARTAEQIGTSTAALQEYRHAASSVGIAAEDMDQILRDLGDRMGDAASGAKGWKENFAHLGVQIFDTTGALRPVEEVFLDVADGMKNADSDATRLFRSMELFGDQGARLLPLLKQGSAGFNALRQEARDLGIVIGDETVQSAVQLQGSLDNLGAMVNAVGVQIVGHAMPTLQAWADQMVETAKSSKGFGEEIATGLKIVITAGKTVMAIFETLGKGLGALAAAAVEVAQGNFRQAFEVIKDSNLETIRIWNEHGREVKEVWASSANAANNGAQKVGDAIRRKFVPPAEDATKAMKALEAEISKALSEGAALEKLGEDFNASLDASKAAARQGMDTILQTEMMEAQATADRLDDIRARLAMDLENVQRQEEEGILDPELAQRQRVALHASAEREMTDITKRETEERVRRQQALMMPLASSLENSFQQFFFDPFDQGLKGMLKAFANTIRQMMAEIAAAGFIKALFGFTTGGFGGAALEAMGFADGGLIRGPGGPTSDQVPAMLSNGEYVVRAAAVQRFGSDFFDRLNSLELPRFASGGLVSSSASASTYAPTINVNVGNNVPNRQSLMGEIRLAVIEGTSELVRELQRTGAIRPGFAG